MHRLLKGLAVAGLAFGMGASGVLAQDLELTIMAPAGAGGGWDSAARSVQETLTATGLAKSAQVINVAGAGGTVGLSQFAGVSGDASQLMIGGITMVGAIISNASPVNLTMVTPLARLTGDPLVIVVPSSSAIQTTADLLAAIKADVGGTIWAGGSAGGADHMLAALLTQAAGEDPAKVNYVAYSGGGEALAAMLGGQVTAGISGYGEWQAQIESGDLRALASTGAARLEGSEIPTLSEAGVDLVVENWRMVAAAPEITEEQKGAINADIEKLVTSATWKSTLETKGWQDMYLAGADFDAQLASDIEATSAILKDVGLVQ